MHKILVLRAAEVWIQVQKEDKRYQNPGHKLFNPGGGNRLNMGGPAESGRHKKTGREQTQIYTGENLLNIIN